MLFQIVGLEYGSETMMQNEGLQLVREDFACPNGCGKTFLTFTEGESAHCYNCNGDFDFGMKKFD